MKTANRFPVVARVVGSFVLVAAAAFGSAAHAEGLTDIGVDATPAHSSLTRAQVEAQVRAARAAGTLAGPGEDLGYPYREAPQANLTPRVR